MEDKATRDPIPAFNSLEEIADFWINIAQPNMPI
jgi:hypothetical protein